MDDSSNLLPWTEKYRPKKLADILGQKEILKSLRAFAKTKNMPHLIFAGPPGVGKTTATLALAHELYGENLSGNILELNASVTPDTPILIKIGGEIKRVNFGWLAEKYYTDSTSKRVPVSDLEVLSLDKEYKIRFMKVGHIFRHKVGEVIKITYEGGEVKTSLDHSIMVFDEDGNIISKKAEEIKKGDLLISFKSTLDGELRAVDLSDYKSSEFCELRSGLQENPTLKFNFDQLAFNDDLSWFFGMYLAEGCTSFNKNGSGGQIIYVLDYPDPIDAVHISRIKQISSSLGLNFSSHLGASGFNRENKTSMQTRIFNTQLTKFMRDNFYDSTEVHRAHTKRIPSFVFQATPESKIAFIKGYWDGDGCGEWGAVARISSVSQECLIDVAWLSRISNIESSVFPREARLIWPNKKFTYIKSVLLPSYIFNKLSKMYGGRSRYILRHSLYSKKSNRVSKEVAREVLDSLYDKKDIGKLRMLVESDLYVVKVTGIKMEEYSDYVYDVSVPGAEVFWGGTTPVLLHNSDERGIDVVRGRIKDFARSVSLGDADFKLIFLDEADALTSDAQHALRRTMESYSRISRFILSCNYSSKLIEPLQSRCALFRFAPLEEKEVKEMVEKVAKEEKLKISEDAYPAIFYVSEGDMRRALNVMQGCAMHSDHITAELVHKISSRAKPKEVREMLELAIGGNFIEARKKLQYLMISYGLSGEDIMMQIYREIQTIDIPEEKRIFLIDKIAEYNFRMVEGAHDHIQLEALLAQFLLVKKKEGEK